MTTIRKAFFAAAVLVPAILVWAQAPKPDATKAPAKSAATKAAAASAGEITGKVTFSGTPPKMKALKMDADPVCAAQHPAPIMSDDALVGADGAVQNALVYVKAGLPAANIPPTPTTPIKIDQKGCIYTPRLVVAMVNQPVEFSNSDETNHHIQAMAEVNKEWTVSQNKGTAVQTTVFDKPEVGILVICHLHPWMRMFVSVLWNPYYAITGADGTFKIKGLPPGYYTLEAWHEKFGTESMKVQAGGKADFTFKAD
jgi:plastocyanin